MATNTWQSNVGGNWSDAANWSQNLVPSSEDSAEIGPAADASWIVTAIDQAAGALLIDTGGLGTLSVGAVLDVTGAMAVASGAVVVQAGGTLVAAGGLTLGSAGRPEAAARSTWRVWAS